MGGKGSGSWTQEIDVSANRRSIGLTRSLYKLPPVDRTDPDAIMDRFDEYLDLCDEYRMRPLVGNYAVAYGLLKQELFAVLTGQTMSGFTSETIKVLKYQYNLVESNFEQSLIESKNPVPGIYYSKAQLGWRETASETVITHRREESPQLSGQTADEIAAKYAQIVGVEDVPRNELPEAASED